MFNLFTALFKRVNESVRVGISKNLYDVSKGRKISSKVVRSARDSLANVKY